MLELCNPFIEIVGSLNESNENGVGGVGGVGVRVCCLPTVSGCTAPLYTEL
jgi:hypothetical protein